LKIFITGGSGFIGRNLIEQMSNKFEIFAPTSRELNLLDSEAVLAYLKENQFDVVIHTATWNATKTSSKDTNLVLDNNLRLFFNLVRGCKFFKKMIYYGSGAEFDRNHWISKMKEDYFDSFVPSDQYGYSKYLMNKFTEKAENIYNLRLFGVYGKYEDWQIRFISQTCCRAIHNIPITINRNVNFDYMFIDDVVEITDWFINNNPKEKVFNVCTGVAISLSELAKKILKITGKKLDIIILKEGMGREYSGDNTKLINEIDNFSFKNIDECILDLYNWYCSISVDSSKL
jgi:GDP-L-fucose synthase